MQQDILNHLQVMKSKFSSYDQEWVRYKNEPEFYSDVAHGSPIRELYSEGRSLSTYLSGRLETQYVNASMLLNEYIEQVRKAIPNDSDYLKIGADARADYEANYPGNYTVRYMIELYEEQWEKIPMVRHLLDQLADTSSHQALVTADPIQVMTQWIYDWEQNIQLHQREDENGLRAQLALGLRNAGFASVSEGFNYQGRADILIPRPPKRGGNAAGNELVVECKIWSGQMAFVAAVSQLCKYLTRHDDQAALIIFVRNEDFARVCDFAYAGLKISSAASDLEGSGALYKLKLKPAQDSRSTVDTTVILCNLVVNRYQ
ncbi:hypothetical protein LOY37_24355 [Pseudomonas sp. B21-012]|uniref:hypothetical protein n=1 Tax=Pseudomonas sp. B21-012 TaxID=2895472 RepID=UPI00215FA04E|nr:hypothetical protein [Pseudomonas sp. B21-012]UVM55428.1 hypothetical protein LOY37_24355 [Pseudomonas sp. B21-012]